MPPAKRAKRTTSNADTKTVNASSASPSPKKAKVAKYLTTKQANALVIDSDIAIQEALSQLEKVRALASKAGLSVECHTLPRTSWSEVASNLQSTNGNGNSGNATSTPSTATPPPSIPAESGTTTLLATGKGNTGGHSNTDHVVVRTGDERQDRLAELRRNLWRRHRNMEPENRGEHRWDKKRVPGERRRRIVRERDLPEAPPEPPPTGYVVFVGQMTTKIRHDRPDVPHDQAKVVQEISKLWRIGMSEEDRNYYNQFAQDARLEYDKQVIEYRATGQFTPNQEFVKLPDVNVWVRRAERRNGLEREICGYSTVVFPKRPPSMDEAYEKREERSKLRRKLKLKGLLNENGTLKDGLDFEELLEQERQGKVKKEEQTIDETSTLENPETLEVGATCQAGNIATI